MALSPKESIVALGAAVFASLLAVIATTAVLVIPAIRKAGRTMPPDAHLGWDPVSFFRSMQLQMALLALVVFIVTFAGLHRYFSAHHR